MTRAIVTVVACATLLLTGTAHAMRDAPGDLSTCNADAAVCAANLTADWARCQAAFSEAAEKLMKRESACIDHCLSKHAGATTDSAPECVFPFAGETAACIATAEDKARAQLTKQCVRGGGRDLCPACYFGEGPAAAVTASCTPVIDTWVEAVTRLIDSKAAMLLCDDTASPDGLSEAEDECRRTAQHDGARFAARVGRCLDECRHAERRGHTAGSCLARDCASAGEIPCDADTAACIARAGERFADKLASDCSDPPDCARYSVFRAAETMQRTAADLSRTAYCDPEPLEPITRIDLSTCGNGVLELTEECDDGNRVPFDGCSAECRREARVAGTGITFLTTKRTRKTPSPIKASLTSPTAGALALVQTAVTRTAPPRITFLGTEIHVEAPPATAAQPLMLKLRIDASALPGDGMAGGIGVFRDGKIVPPCRGAAGTAVPDPCVWGGMLLRRGGVSITVLMSSPGGDWDLAPGCFQDSGTGVIEDVCEGREWEKLDGSDGIPNPANLHDVDNLYRWVGWCLHDDAPCQPNGRAEHLCKLHTRPEHWSQGCETCPTGSCQINLDSDVQSNQAVTTIWDHAVQLNDARYAGHANWRPPSVAAEGEAAELESIYNSTFLEWGSVSLATPAIPPIFGPTALHTPYWSGTTWVVGADKAWLVHFDEYNPLSRLRVDGKWQTNAVRAVHVPTEPPFTCFSLDVQSGTTILDDCEHLEWEKLDGSDGIPNPADLHDVDNRYTWAGRCTISGHSCQPNLAAAQACVAQTDTDSFNYCGLCGSPLLEGVCDVDVNNSGAVTTVWDRVARLNASRYANRADWRMPSPSQLASMFAKGFGACGVPPVAAACVEPVFSPTFAGAYWTAASKTDPVANAMVVFFSQERVAWWAFTNAAFARVVRCTNGPCQPVATCSDGIWNGDETQTDCGGPDCRRCPIGRSCRVDGDCESGKCALSFVGSSVLVCQAPSCTDGVRNGEETDVDCGNSVTYTYVNPYDAADCPPCQTGQLCLVATDCVEKVCTDGVCSPPRCDDNVRNGAETGTDCGGPTACGRCADGSTCRRNDDCAAPTWCDAGVCHYPLKTVFVTERLFWGDFASGTLVPDNPWVLAAEKCQEEANDAGLSGTFLAWISYPLDCPATSFWPSGRKGPWRRVDGVTIANDWADLTDGTIAAPINITARGQRVEPSLVLTGTSIAGTLAPGVFGDYWGSTCKYWTDTCEDWFWFSRKCDLAGPYRYVGGFTEGYDASWTCSTSWGDCDEEKGRFYCFEQ